MRRLVLPVALSVVVVGCASSSAPVDGAVADAQDASDERADAVVCEGRRTDAGRVVCHQEGIAPGSPFACIQRTCDADDGGADLGDCCRLL